MEGCPEQGAVWSISGWWPDHLHDMGHLWDGRSLDAESTGGRRRGSVPRERGIRSSGLRASRELASLRADSLWWPLGCLSCHVAA